MCIFSETGAGSRTARNSRWRLLANAADKMPNDGKQPFCVAVPLERYEQTNQQKPREN